MSSRYLITMEPVDLKSRLSMPTDPIDLSSVGDPANSFGIPSCRGCHGVPCGHVHLSTYWLVETSCTVPRVHPLINWRNAMTWILVADLTYATLTTSQTPSRVEFGSNASNDWYGRPVHWLTNKDDMSNQIMLQSTTKDNWYCRPVLWSTQPKIG